MATNYSYHYVLLPDGSLKYIHGKVVGIAAGRSRCNGYVYIKGRRVYGTAQNWSYVSNCFTFFEPRGKWAHLADPAAA